MNSRVAQSLIVLILFCLLLGSLSCAREQQLVSITVNPSGGFVFGGLGAQGQFTALGTFIHPPETKDITNQVVWKLDVSNFADLTQSGLITYTRADGCGSGDVSATHSTDPNSTSTTGSVVVGSAPVKGVNDGADECKP